MNNVDIIWKWLVEEICRSMGFLHWICFNPKISGLIFTWSKKKRRWAGSSERDCLAVPSQQPWLEIFPKHFLASRRWTIYDLSLKLQFSWSNRQKAINQSWIFINLFRLLLDFDFVRFLLGPKPSGWGKFR